MLYLERMRVSRAPLWSTKVDKDHTHASREESGIYIQYDRPEIIEIIDSRERAPFKPGESDPTATSTNLAKLEGYFVSLDKETNSGTFSLTDGTRVSYQYVGDKPYNLHRHFAHRGPIRVSCIARLNEALRPTMLDIRDIERLQGDLEF